MGKYDPTFLPELTSQMLDALHKHGRIRARSNWHAGTIRLSSRRFLILPHKNVGIPAICTCLSALPCAYFGSLQILPEAISSETAVISAASGRSSTTFEDFARTASYALVAIVPVFKRR